MSISSQKIVLFIEPSDDAFSTPSKIGHLFMNRFVVDEDPGFEIVKVLELEKTSDSMSYLGKQKGIDLMSAIELFRLLKFNMVHTVWTILYSLKVLVHDSYGTIHTD